MSVEERVVAKIMQDSYEVCYKRNITRSKGLWRAESPLVTSLPIFVLQLLCIILTIRIITLLLKPLRQPRIVAEILVRMCVCVCVYMCVLVSSYYLIDHHQF
jgi:hypothetical protein